MTPPDVGVVVIGAGQAGLAAGRALQKARLDHLLLEAGRSAGGSWPYYYDSLTLFSPVAYSSLPDLQMPGPHDHYPSRDEVVSYLEAYAHAFALPIRFDARVTSVEEGRRSYSVRLDGGETLRCRAIIVATGTFGSPYRPVLAGSERYEGHVLHAADYRNPSALAGQRVVVVGAANSAVQIAVELAEVADVTIASRKPIRYVPQRFLGKDVHFWFRRLGIDSSSLFSDQGTPVLDSGRYKSALSNNKPDRRPMFNAMTEKGVIWSEGREERIDALLLATGYRPHVPFLDASHVLTPRGRLRQRGGRSTAHSRLYYVGQPGLTRFASGVLRGVGHDAEHVVAQITADLGV